MKRTLGLAALSLVLMTGCGDLSRGTEAVGQVKSVYNETPLIFPDYVQVDLSLGVMRNGVGSMSTQDIFVLLKDPMDIALAKQAQQEGQLVKVTYDHQRLNFWSEARQATKIELLK